MHNITAIDLSLKGKELEMECVKAALFQEGINAVFREVEAAYISYQEDN